MKKEKAPKVPVLEQALELNLPKLMRAAKAAGSGRLVLIGEEMRTVVMLSETRLAARLGGRAWVADIVSVPCLSGRLRPLLKCPRAHEGNFQSLYYFAGKLACRHCHRLRYRSNLAPCAAMRGRIARSKFLSSMGAEEGMLELVRQPLKWRKRHHQLAARAHSLAAVHYANLRAWLGQRKRLS